MKTIVYNLQHENWEDDGGDHDPVILEIEDSEYEEIVMAGVLESDTPLFEKLSAARRDDAQSVTFPIQVDDVMTIWFTY